MSGRLDGIIRRLGTEGYSEARKIKNGPSMPDPDNFGLMVTKKAREPRPEVGLDK